MSLGDDATDADTQPMLLRVADIALAAGVSRSSVKRWLAVWEVRPNDRRVPRVVRRSAGGRPGFRVDADEFSKWLAGAEDVRGDVDWRAAA